MTQLESLALSILHQAAEAEFGIVISVTQIPVSTNSNATLPQPTIHAKQILYRFKTQDADLENLQIFLSPDNPDTELWITNPKQET